MTPLDARRAHDIGDVCDRLFTSLASGIEAFGRDRATGRDAKHESPAPKGDAK